MCRWVSTKPGITIEFDASITWALAALMFGFTAEILLPSISTSACSKSPTDLSSESTQPPLSRIGRPAGLGAACASPALIALASAGAVAVTAAVVHRNCRRDRPLRGAQHGHAEVNAWFMGSSLGSLVVARMLVLPHISI